jgi:ABC-type transporter Mla subunit MlaD
MRYVRILLPVLAATALLVGAGCGGGSSDSNDEYADEVRQVLDPLGDELSQIGDVVSQSKDAQQLADSVQKAEGEIQGAVDELEAIDPPSDVEGAHQELITALDGFNAALKELSDAAETGNTSEILSSATKLPTAVTDLRSDLNSVKTQLEDAGIDVSN